MTSHSVWHHKDRLIRREEAGDWDEATSARCSWGGMVIHHYEKNSSCESWKSEWIKWTVSHSWEEAPASWRMISGFVNEPFSRLFLRTFLVSAVIHNALLLFAHACWVSISKELSFKHGIPVCCFLQFFRPGKECTQERSSPPEDRRQFLSSWLLNTTFSEPNTELLHLLAALEKCWFRFFFFTKCWMEHVNLSHQGAFSHGIPSHDVSMWVREMMSLGELWPFDLLDQFHQNKRNLKQTSASNTTPSVFTQLNV